MPPRDGYIADVVPMGDIHLCKGSSHKLVNM